MIFFSGCGRRQKNIFYFPDPAQENKDAFNVNPLLLPFVRDIKLEKTDKGNLITWQSIKDSERFYAKNNYPTIKYKKELLGYNIYKLVSAFFIPKKALNSDLIKSTEYLDESILNQLVKDKTANCYLVRAVFKVEDKIFHGPASQIVCDS